MTYITVTIKLMTATTAMTGIFHLAVVLTYFVTTLVFVGPAVGVLGWLVGAVVVGCTSGVLTLFGDDVLILLAGLGVAATGPGVSRGAAGAGVAACGCVVGAAGGAAFGLGTDRDKPLSPVQTDTMSVSHVSDACAGDAIPRKNSPAVMAINFFICS